MKLSGFWIGQQPDQASAVTREELEKLFFDDLMMRQKIEEAALGSLLAESATSFKLDGP